MMRRIMFFSVLPALAIGCGGEALREDPIDPGLLRSPIIESEIVSTFDVWGQIDPARTYWSLCGTVEPESVIVALWQAELPVSRAWQPLDNRCMDPIGPRFAVELVAGDERMLEHDFETGPGRFLCSTIVEQFTVSE